MRLSDLYDLYEAAPPTTEEHKMVPEIENLVPRVSGIYMFSKFGVPLYIGQSKDIYIRLLYHLENTVNPKELKYMYFKRDLKNIEFEIVETVSSAVLEFETLWNKLMPRNQREATTLSKKEKLWIECNEPLFNIKLCPWKPNQKEITRKQMERLIAATTKEGTEEVKEGILICISKCASILKNGKNVFDE